jgi:hypothetical protein
MEKNQYHGTVCIILLVIVYLFPIKTVFPGAIFQEGPVLNFQSV